MSKIIFVRKEKGYTSFDVCNKLKRVFNTRRIGHTGTLDPNAEGLLIVMVDEACKVLPYIHHMKKTYIATMRLGIKTDTGDIWGNVIEEKDYIMPDELSIKQCLDSFMGASMQIPPMTSAIKVNGKKLYELQREGITIEREPRPIFVSMIKLLEVGDEIKFEVEVSSGCYIRSLIEDIALKLGSIGTMTSLIRTKIDEINVSEAFTLEQIINNQHVEYTKEDILSRYYDLIEYNDETWLKNGKRIKVENDNDVVMMTHNGKIIAAYERENASTYKSKRGLW